MGEIWEKLGQMVFQKIHEYFRNYMSIRISYQWNSKVVFIIWMIKRCISFLSYQQTYLKVYTPDLKALDAFESSTSVSHFLSFIFCSLWDSAHPIPSLQSHSSLPVVRHDAYAKWSRNPDAFLPISGTKVLPSKYIGQTGTHNEKDISTLENCCISIEMIFWFLC